MQGPAGVRGCAPACSRRRAYTRIGEYGRISRAGSLRANVKCIGLGAERCEVTVICTRAASPPLAPPTGMVLGADGGPAPRPGCPGPWRTPDTPTGLDTAAGRDPGRTADYRSLGLEEPLPIPSHRGAGQGRVTHGCEDYSPGRSLPTNRGGRKFKTSSTVTAITVNVTLDDWYWTLGETGI